MSADSIDVYLEVTAKKAIAGAVDWPGWNRSGRDADAALAALFESTPRYTAVLKAAHIRFAAPNDIGALKVVEELEGNATSAFGAPDIPPAADAAPLDAAALTHQVRLMTAYWDAFERAAKAAAGKELRRGPRGGGRELDAVIAHTLGAEASYMGRLAYKWQLPADAPVDEQLAQTHQAALAALERAAKGDMPAQGPRGGKLWTPRFFVRRAGWHVLDHAWELEDRVM